MTGYTAYTKDGADAAFSAKSVEESVGQANGIAQLDATGLLPEAQVPARLAATELTSTIVEVGSEHFVTSPALQDLPLSLADAAGAQAAPFAPHTLGPAWNAMAGVGTKPFNVLCIGDSVTEGYTLQPSERWLTKLTTLLRRRHQPRGIAGGEGYIPAFYAATSGMPSRWTLTGAPAQNTGYGLGLRALLLATGTAATITFTGTGFDLFWAGGPNTGVISYTVDGGTATSITTTKTTIKDGYTTSVRGLARGSHTVTVAYVSGGTSVFDGIMIYDGDEAAGVHVWDSGHSGAYSSQFASGAWFDSITPTKPDLVTIELGLNDYQQSGVQSATPAQLAANITAIITAIRARGFSPTFVILSTWRRPFTSGANDWPAYVAAMEGLATTDALVTYIDLAQVINPGDPGTSQGLLQSDEIHPTAFGGTIIASTIYNCIAPPSGNAVPRSVQDTFARADSALLGITEVGDAAWRTVQNPSNTGTVAAAISGDALVLTPASSTSSEGFAICETFTASGTVSITSQTLASSTTHADPGLVFRMSDASNFWLLWANQGGGYKLMKCVAGVYTAAAASATVAAAGDVLAVTLSGASISATVNGTVMATLTDTFNQTATLHGVRASANSSVGAAVAFDEFAVSAA